MERKRERRDATAKEKDEDPGGGEGKKRSIGEIRKKVGPLGDCRWIYGVVGSRGQLSADASSMQSLAMERHAKEFRVESV